MEPQRRLAKLSGFLKRRKKINSIVIKIIIEEEGIRKAILAKKKGE